MFIESRTSGGKYILNMGNTEIKLDGLKGAKLISDGRYEVTLARLNQIRKGLNVFASAGEAFAAMKAKARAK